MNTKTYTHKIVSVLQVPGGPYLINFGEVEGLGGDTKGFSLSQDMIEKFSLQEKLNPGSTMTYTKEFSEDENGNKKSEVVSIVIE